MKIDLSTEISNQLKRCQALADDAETDTSSLLSQRAAALTAMNNLLRDITKSQLEVINMSRLQVLEQTLVELLNEMLTETQIAEFMTEYEKRLAILDQTSDE